MDMSTRTVITMMAMNMAMKGTVTDTELKLAQPLSP
jgi:hypothetical protein